MPLTIPVAHDFICPWCWVGLFQAQRLQRELGVRIDWRGYELYPDELEWPDHPAVPQVKTNRPKTPGRLDFLLVAEGLELPHVERPKKMRTHNAHEAVEYAKTEGVADDLIEVLYRAYWERGEQIDDPKVLKKLARGIVSDIDAMLKAIERRRFKGEIVGFDEPAYHNGVYNVPTFFIGGERYAEQPYATLRKAVDHALEDDGTHGIYKDLRFPVAPKDRPYVYTNMVVTIDGKSLSGGRNESVIDLGSKADHKIMNRLEKAADAVLLGAQTLRATPASWDPKAPKRIVVTQSGDIPARTEFLDGGEGYVATSGSSQFALPAGAKILRAGGTSVDLTILLGRLRQGLGVERLLVLGGSEINGGFLKLGLVDELFVTIAPKVKLGRDVPTYAGGDPLPKGYLQRYRLVENHVVGDEVFLRYRREPHDE